MPIELPYRNPSLSLEARLDDLMGRLTSEEKIGQIQQLPLHYSGTLAECQAARCGSILCYVGEQIRPLQEAALATRWGIPLLVGIDAIHGHSMWDAATMFPSALSLSCSWDVDLCTRIARTTAIEVCHTGIHWNFSPVLCLPRDLRWGRTGETFGEDATLIGVLGAATIRGYQTDDLSRPDAIAACAKHFVGYGESEGGRDGSESGHSLRTLRAVFLPPFKAAADAGVATWMTAYHAIDGVPVAFDSKLLVGILRTEWQATGVVVTDWDIIGRMHNSRRICPTLADGAMRTVNAGNDMIMNTPTFYVDTVANLAAGKVAQKTIDSACRRVLELKFRMGLFENPRLPDEAKARAVSGTPAHRALAVEAAQKSLVLLKNRGVLPLRRSHIKRIAVLGPASDDVLSTLGDWSLGAGQGQGARDSYPRHMTETVLDGLRALAGEGITVDHGYGCGVAVPRWIGWPPKFESHVLGDGVHESAPNRIVRAVRLAEAADVVVLVLGDHNGFLGEMKSTATLDLPGEQQALFDAVVATGTPVVVVLVTSKPLSIPRLAKQADAIVCAYNPGMGGGTAIAQLLFGDIEPRGKLTISWPHHVGQQPVRYDQAPGAHQSGYPDLPDVGFDALFPFGFGLSYSTLRYRGLSLKSHTLAQGQAVEATVRLANTGQRPVDEIVQIYLHDRYTSVVWPTKKLKTWVTVHLEPGEERTVAVTVPFADLALCDADGNWVVESGDFELLAGGSSRDSDLLRAPFSVM